MSLASLDSMSLELGGSSALSLFSLCLLRDASNSEGNPLDQGSTQRQRLHWSPPRGLLVCGARAVVLS
jgi:hypothetical protein